MKDQVFVYNMLWNKQNVGSDKNGFIVLFQN